MSKNNLTDNHIKYLAQRDSNKRDLEKQKKLAEEKKQLEKEKQARNKLTAKCDGSNIFIILSCVTVFIAINYIIGSSIIIFFTKYPDEKVAFDFPTKIDASPFCGYSEEALKKDNKILNEENKKFAGPCSFIEMLKAFFKMLLALLKKLGVVKDYVVEKLAYVYNKMSDKINGLFNIIPLVLGLTTKIVSIMGAMSKGKKEIKQTGGADAEDEEGGEEGGDGEGGDGEGGDGGEAEAKEPESNRDENEIFKMIDETTTPESTCKGFFWDLSQNLPVFGEKGDKKQQHYTAVHLYNGPLHLQLIPSLTLVSIATYLTMNNSSLKKFFYLMRSVVPNKKADDYYTTAYIATISPIIMVAFIMYYTMCHFITIIYMIPAIIGDDLGRYVASNETNKEFYCIRENIKWLFTKIGTLIWTPIVVSFMYGFGLLYSLHKLFFAPCLENITICKEIIKKIYKIIIFIWLILLCIKIFTQYGKCPDDLFINIGGTDFVQKKLIPLQFIAISFIIYLYIYMFW